MFRGLPAILDYDYEDDDEQDAQPRLVRESLSRVSSLYFPMQDRALVLGGGARLGDAVHEADLHGLIVEAARDGVMVRGFVIAQHDLEGVWVGPRAGVCDFGFGPLRRCAA